MIPLNQTIINGIVGNNFVGRNDVCAQLLTQTIAAHKTLDALTAASLLIVISAGISIAGMFLFLALAIKQKKEREAVKKGGKEEETQPPLKQ